MLLSSPKEIAECGDGRVFLQEEARSYNVKESVGLW